MDVKPRVVAAAGCALLLVVAGPYGGAIGQDVSSSTIEQPLSLDCDPTLSDACASLRLRAGRRLFDVETFDGNGRTCRTCHSNRTGTFSPEDARARLAEDPNDALFLHDGLDDGMAGTSRITEHATVRIEIPLPPDVVLLDDPTRRSVILNRGTPTTMNTPALDPQLMYDTREPNLQSQAFSAIHGHAQNTREPTALELDLIKEFQHLRGESPGHALQATALVHEVYLRLVDVDRMTLTNRAHFLGVAATLMRQILVGHARRQRADKRGGGVTVLSLDESAASTRWTCDRSSRRGPVPVRTVMVVP